MQYNMHAEHDGTITVINIMSRMKHQHQSQHQTPTPNTQQQHQYPNQCQYQYQRYYNCFAESFSFHFFLAVTRCFQTVGFIMAQHCDPKPWLCPRWFENVKPTSCGTLPGCWLSWNPTHRQMLGCHGDVFFWFTIGCHGADALEHLSVS